MRSALCKRPASDYHVLTGVSRMRSIVASKCYGRPATRTQFVRDAVDYLQITPLYTPTDDQPADGLTKAVGADVIRRHLPYYTGTCDCPDMHNIYT